MTTTPPTEQPLASDDRAIQALSDQGAQCGDCGDEPGDRVCPDCEKYRRWYVDALRAAGWAPRDEVLREVADMADPAAPEVSFFGGMVGPSVAAWLRMLADRAARDAAPEATSAPLAASQPSEVPTEPETATEAPEGPPRDSGTLESESPLPDRLEAVLTQRFTELGNPFSRMSINFQGPDGWPASKGVGPHDVAEVLRELLAATTEETAPAEDFTGTQPCGHDDYHDPHPWADRPDLWCPGIGYDDDQATTEEATR